MGQVRLRWVGSTEAFTTPTVYIQCRLLVLTMILLQIHFKFIPTQHVLQWQQEMCLDRKCGLSQGRARTVSASATITSCSKSKTHLIEHSVTSVLTGCVHGSSHWVCIRLILETCWNFRLQHKTLRGEKVARILPSKQDWRQLYF